MPLHPESRDLARAIRRKGTELVHVHGHRIRKALVVQTGPLVVELTQNDVQIEEDHLLLGALMRWYDSKVGLDVDDLVLVTRLDDGDWLVHDVVTQNNLGALGLAEPVLADDAARLP